MRYLGLLVVPEPKNHPPLTRGHDKARASGSGTHYWITFDLGSKTPFHFERHSSRPDATAMETFCRNVLLKLGQTTSDVCFCVDRSEPMMKWEAVGQKLGISFSHSARHVRSPDLVDSLLQQIRSGRPRGDSPT
jgi:hypothetical protein